MEKFKQIKQKITDFLYIINDYYSDHLWLRIFLTVIYFVVLILGLLLLTVHWLYVFDNSICGEDIICCVLSYLTFYQILLRKVD